MAIFTLCPRPLAEQRDRPGADHPGTGIRRGGANETMPVTMLAR
jgi:hypothetical protein